MLVVACSWLRYTQARVKQANYACGVFISLRPTHRAAMIGPNAELGIRLVADVNRMENNTTPGGPPGQWSAPVHLTSALLSRDLSACHVVWHTS